MSDTSNYAMWCRERARRDLEALERLGGFLGPYAETHDLVVEWPPNHYTAADRADSRSNGAVDALRWLGEEIKWTRDQLKVFERSVA